MPFIWDGHTILLSVIVDPESSLESFDDLDFNASFFMESDNEEDISTTDTTNPKEHTDTTNPDLPRERPLYSGAPDGLTEYMAHLLLFQYSTRHSLTGRALQELLQLLIIFLPAGARIPKSVRKLKQYFLMSGTGLESRVFLVPPLACLNELVNQPCALNLVPQCGNKPYF